MSKMRSLLKTMTRKGMNRSWLVIFVLVIAWVIGGFIWDKTQFGPDLYNISVVALPFSCLLFIAEYTVMGFRGAAKWWTTEIGTRIVMKDVAIIFSSSVLAWAQLFDHGLIDTPLPAWIYVGGITGAALIILWGCLIWLRIWRQGRLPRNGSSEQE